MLKYIIALLTFIAVIVGVFSIQTRPKIDVSAEANATSTVIVPKTIVPITTSTSSNVSHETPKVVNVYNTYEAPVTAGSMVETVEPKPEAVEAPVNELITYVPTPVFTTVYVPQEPVYVAPTPVHTAPTPVTETIVEPELIEEPFYSEWPHYWIEERNSGRYIFFKATWSDGTPGQIVCNGIKQGRPPQSGKEAIVEEKNLADQINSGTIFAPERYVSCTFSVGDHGGVTANITVK